MSSALSGLGVAPLSPSPPPSPPLPSVDAPRPRGLAEGDVLRQVEVVRPAEPAALTNSELLVLRISTYVKTRRAALALCVLAAGVWMGAVAAAVAVVAACVIERALANPIPRLKEAILSKDVQAVRDALSHWQERYGHLPESTQRQFLDAIDEVDAFEELEHELAYVRLPLCESMSDVWLSHWHEDFRDLSIQDQRDHLQRINNSAMSRGNTQFAGEIRDMRDKLLEQAPKL